MFYKKIWEGLSVNTHPWLYAGDYRSIASENEEEILDFIKLQSNILGSSKGIEH